MLKYLFIIFQIIFFVGCTSKKSNYGENNEIKKYSELGVKTITEINSGRYINNTIISTIDESGKVIKRLDKKNNQIDDYVYEDDKLIKIMSKEGNNHYEELYFYDDNENISKIIVNDSDNGSNTVYKAIYEYDENTLVQKETIYRNAEDNTLEISNVYLYKNSYSNGKISKVVKYYIFDTEEVKSSETYYNIIDRPEKVIIYDDGGNIVFVDKYFYNSDNSINMIKEYHRDGSTLSSVIKYEYANNSLLKSVTEVQKGTNQKVRSKVKYKYTYYPVEKSFLSYLKFWETKPILSLDNPNGIVGTIWSSSDKYGNILEYYKFHDSVFVKLFVKGEHIERKRIVEWELVDGNDGGNFPELNDESKLNPAIVVLNYPNVMGRPFSIIQKNENYFIGVKDFWNFDNEIKLMNEEDIDSKIINNLNSLKE